MPHFELDRWIFYGGLTSVDSRFAGPARFEGVTALDGPVTRLGVEVFFDLAKVVPFSGDAVQAGTVTLWQVPFDLIVTRCLINVLVPPTVPARIDVGLTDVSPTTSSDTLINNATTVNPDGIIDSLPQAPAQKALAGTWITVTKSSGNPSGAQAVAYLFFVRI